MTILIDVFILSFCFYAAYRNQSIVLNLVPSIVVHCLDGMLSDLVLWDCIFSFIDSCVFNMGRQPALNHSGVDWMIWKRADADVFESLEVTEWCFWINYSIRPATIPSHAAGAAIVHILHTSHRNHDYFSVKVTFEKFTNRCVLNQGLWDSDQRCKNQDRRGWVQRDSSI